MFKMVGQTRQKHLAKELAFQGILAEETKILSLSQLFLNSYMRSHSKANERVRFQLFITYPM